MITIYGASDDLVEVEGCEGADEFNVYGSDGKVHWRGDFTAPDGPNQPTFPADAVRVYAIYDGCWHFSVGQVSEDVPIPDWGNGINQRHDTAYSAELRIDAPAGTRLTKVWPEADED